MTPVLVLRVSTTTVPVAGSNDCVGLEYRTAAAEAVLLDEDEDDADVDGEAASVAGANVGAIALMLMMSSASYASSAMDDIADRFRAEYDCTAVWFANWLLELAANAALLVALSVDEAESIGGGGGEGVLTAKLPVELDDEDAADEPLSAPVSRAASNALMSALTAEVALLDEDALEAWVLEEDEADDVPPRELIRLPSNEATVLLTLSDEGATPFNGGGSGCTPMAAVLAELDDDAVTPPTCCAARSADCVTALRLWNAEAKSLALMLDADDALEAEDVELAEVLALLTP